MRTNVTLWLALAAGLHAGAAFADPLGDLFSATKDVCFERSYSAGHLAKVPGQSVEFIRFAHLRSIATDDFEPVELATTNPVADIEVRFRGDPKSYGNAIVCSRGEDGQRCGVECDGGEFLFRFDANGSMLVDFRKTNPMVVEGGCDGADGAKLRLVGEGTDDKLFRLDRVDAAKCVSPVKALRKQLSAQ